MRGFTVLRCLSSHSKNIYLLLAIAILIYSRATEVVGQVYCPGPASISCPAVSQPVVWAGTAFTGQCPTDTIALTGLTTANISDEFTCGLYTVTVDNVEDEIIDSIPITRVTSSLSFTADPSIDGLSVMCGTAGSSPEVSMTITVPGIPTPVIAAGQDSLTELTVDFTVTDTRCPGLISHYTAVVISESGTKVTTNSSTPSVSVSNLDLCRNRYSVVGYIQSSTDQGPESSLVNIASGIAGVADVIVSPSGLEWTQLPNSGLPECITGYHISWFRGEFNTSGSSTSLSEIPGFLYCWLLTVTVAPNTPNGVFTDGSSTGRGYITTLDIPLPHVIPVFVESRPNIQVTIFANAHAVTMYGISPVGSSCQPLTSLDQTTVLPDGAVSGDQYTVCVDFTFIKCTSTGDINFTIPARSFETISPSATTTSITVTVTLLDPPPHFDRSLLSIYSTISSSDASPVLEDYPSTGNSYTVTFTGLAQGTMYTYEIRVVFRDDPSIITSTLLGLAVTGVVSTGGCGGGCTGGIIVSIVAIFTVLVNSIIVVICMKKKASKSSPPGNVPEDPTELKGPMYEDIKPDPSNL